VLAAQAHLAPNSGAGGASHHDSESQLGRGRGGGSTLNSRFPSAGRLIRLLDTPETQEALRSQPAKSAMVQMAALAERACGAEARAAWELAFGSELHAYVHAYVARTTQPFAPLRLDDQVALYVAVVRASGPAVLASSGSIHAACWASERRLFHACSLLSTVGPLAGSVVQHLETLTVGGATLADVDEVMLSAVLDHWTAKVRSGVAAGGARGREECCESMRRVQSSSADVEVLLSLLRDCAGAGASAASERHGAAIEARFLCLRLLLLLVREVILASGSSAPPRLHDFEAFLGQAGTHRIGEFDPLLELLAPVARIAMVSPSTDRAASSVPSSFSGTSGSGTDAAFGMPVTSWSNFVVCYVKELLLPCLVQAGGSDASHPTLRSTLQLTGFLLRFALKSTNSPLPPLSRSSSALLLRTLFENATHLPSLEAHVHTLEWPGHDSAAMLLQYHEQALLQRADPLQMSEAETSALAKLGGAAGHVVEILKAPGALSALRSIASGKLHIVRFIRDLVAALRFGVDSDAANVEMSEATRRLLLDPSRPLKLQVFALRELFQAGGVPMLSKLSTLPVTSLQWLPFDVSKLESGLRAQVFLDPFRWLLELYPPAPTRDGGPLDDGFAVERRRARYHQLHDLCRRAYAFRGSKQELKELEKSLANAHDAMAVVTLAAAAFALRDPLIQWAGGKSSATETAGSSAGSGARPELLLAPVQNLGHAWLRSLVEWLLEGGRSEHLYATSWEWRPHEGSSSTAAVAECTRAVFLRALSKVKAKAGGALDRGASLGMATTGLAGKRRSALMLQLAVHLALRAASAIGSWWFSMLTEPAAQLRGYVPAMPTSEMISIVRGVGSSGWYKCANGHLYTVSACTMPMQLASCLACGAKIGGENHKSVEGVKRVDDGRGNMQWVPPTRKGYMREAVVDSDFSEAARAGSTAVIVLRLFTHLLLQVSAASELGGHTPQVAILLGFQRDQDAALRHLVECVERDWNALLAQFGLDDSELALALQLVARRMLVAQQVEPAAGGRMGGYSDGSTNGVFTNSVSRCMWEVDFQSDAVTPIFGTGLQSALQAARDELQQVDASRHFRTAMGDELWTAISAPGTDPAVPSSPAPWLWNTPLDCSLALFKREFALRASTAARCPILATLVRSETLPLVQCITDILQWHAVLFGALEGAGLRRDEAAALSSRELVEGLGGARRQQAAAALAAFCDTFNRSFHLVVNLFECQENPFLYGPGGAKQIDLSLAGGAGGPVQMSPTFPSPSRCLRSCLATMRRAVCARCSCSTCSLKLTTRPWRSSRPSSRLSCCRAPRRVPPSRSRRRAR